MNAAASLTFSLLTAFVTVNNGRAKLLRALPWHAYVTRPDRELFAVFVRLKPNDVTRRVFRRHFPEPSKRLTPLQRDKNIAKIGFRCAVRMRFDLFLFSPIIVAKR